MAWDWEKLNRQHHQQPGGVPPQMDEFVEKIKRVKFPGGPLFIIIVILVALALTTFYTVKQNEVGVVQLFGRYPHTTLAASGHAVGLPDGQMGNSEVGHLNIGAGRIVYQELLRINNAIKSGELSWWAVEDLLAGAHQTVLDEIREAAGGPAR